ncbi:hypothetical protein GGF31_006754 [Allomyces arbusculus]|nr:hypothetical protein GGF31_006754 [Allomyces arbusculus]
MGSKDPPFRALPTAAALSLRRITGNLHPTLIEQLARMPQLKSIDGRYRVDVAGDAPLPEWTLEYSQGHVVWTSVPRMELTGRFTDRLVVRAVSVDDAAKAVSDIERMLEWIVMGGRTGEDVEPIPVEKNPPETMFSKLSCKFTSLAATMRKSMRGRSSPSSTTSAATAAATAAGAVTAALLAVPAVGTAGVATAATYGTFAATTTAVTAVTATTSAVSTTAAISTATIVKILAGALVGAVAAPFIASGAVVMLAAVLGFSAVGIVAGSAAAWLMSVLGGAATASGSLVAIFQAIGATGAVVFSGAVAGVLGAVGGVLGGLLGFLF